jgi:hypothetical protein
MVEVAWAAEVVGLAEVVGVAGVAGVAAALVGTITTGGSSAGTPGIVG